MIWDCVQERDQSDGGMKPGWKRWQNHERGVLLAAMTCQPFTSRPLASWGQFLILAVLGGFGTAMAAVHEVGPGKPLNSLGEVPWEALGPGDEVRIHWRAQPYAEKWALCTRGTADRPIVVRGIPGPGGRLPVIDGRDATTRSQLNYWGQERGVLKIGGTNLTTHIIPGHLIVENLEIRSGRRPHVFHGRKGRTSYSKDAASVNVEIVEHLVLRNLVLHDSSNGLLVSPQSKDVRVERCRLYDNGNPGSISEHNAYTECLGMVYEGNWFGPLRAGCRGNNLKDRSAGLVVACNWIEGGNRQLDLVEAMGNPAINAAREYRRTVVYGNVLIEREGDGNNQIVHYGGDMGDATTYRKGTLQFYHNTVISTRLSPVAIFRLSSPDESVECWNNILHAATGGKNLTLMVTVGTLKLGKNWLTRGWVTSYEAFAGRVDEMGPLMDGEAPGWSSGEKQDFRLNQDSPCWQAAAKLPEGWTVPGQSYDKHQKVIPRSDDGRSLNLGAF